MKKSLCIVAMVRVVRRQSNSLSSFIDFSLGSFLQTNGCGQDRVSVRPGERLTVDNVPAADSHAGTRQYWLRSLAASDALLSLWGASPPNPPALAALDIRVSEAELCAGDPIR